MNVVLFTDKPLTGCGCRGTKKVGSIDFTNPLVVTPLVAIGAYFLAKSLKVI